MLYAIISSSGIGWQHFANLTSGFAMLFISTKLPSSLAETDSFFVNAPIGIFWLALMNWIIFDFAFVVLTILSQSLFGLAVFAVIMLIMSPFFNSYLKGIILPFTTAPIHRSPMLV